jgi:hypothetical protein
VCDNGVCRQYSQTGQHLTVVYARPHRNVPLQSDQTRPVPVILKVESQDVDLPVLTAEKQLQAEMDAFLKQADLVKLTAPFSKK